MVVTFAVTGMKTPRPIVDVMSSQGVIDHSIRWHSRQQPLQALLTQTSQTGPLQANQLSGKTGIECLGG